MANNLWITEDRDVLTRMWEKHSAREIGIIVGRSRNAVIGMARRLGLSPKKSIGGRPMGIPQPARPPKPQKLTKIIAGEPEAPISPPAAPEPLPEPVEAHPVGIAFMEAREGQCRAVLDPHGAPNGLATFCGKPVELGKKFTFCADHYAEYTYSLRGR